MGGGGSKTQTTTSQSTPWGPHEVQLRNILNNAGALYNQQQANGIPWPGSQYVGVNPQQLLGQQMTLDWANGPMQALSNQGYQLGTNLQNQGALSANNAQNWANGGFNQGTALTNNAVNSIAAYGQQGMGAGASGINALMDAYQRAGEDRTGAIVQAANEYANNPVINGAIDAASRDVTRNLQENELTSLNRQASLGGNLNSSRAGAAQAIAERGAADRIADISSTMRSQAYQQGLTMAQNQDQFGTGALLNAGNSLSDVGNARAGILGNAANLSEQQRVANMGFQMDANGQLQNTLNQGMNMADQASRFGYGAANANQDIGNIQQGHAQQALNDRVREANAPNEWAWNQLANYTNIVNGTGAGQFASQSTTQPKQSSGSGLWNGILGAASVVAAPYTGGASLAAYGALNASGAMGGGGGGGGALAGAANAYSSPSNAARSAYVGSAAPNSTSDFGALSANELMNNNPYKQSTGNWFSRWF